MWWWLLTRASFVRGGGCLCVPSSLLVERGAKHLEVGLNPQKEFKRTHLQLKGNRVPDNYNMSLFKREEMGTPPPKKSARYLQAGFHMQNQFCAFHCREDRHPSQGEENCFYFTYQSASHAFLLGVLVNAAHAFACGEIRTCFVPLVPCGETTASSKE